MNLVKIIFVKITILIILFFFFNRLSAQPGCTDPQALNYDANANENDGSCIYPITNYELSQICELPETLEECSGSELINSGLWIHNDGGNEHKIYRIDSLNGNILQTVTVGNAENIDWEDLAMDDMGNLYIGDFGNNANNRDNLSIHVLDSNLNFDRTIKYTYPDQSEFPPIDKENFNYDCEAFFWLNEKLYLFTKNMKNPYTRVYEMDLLHENQVNLIDSIYLNSPITAADVRSDGREAVLLSYGKLFFIDISPENSPPTFAHGYCKKFRNSGQSEAIAYINDNKVMITNENGKVFLLSREPKDN